MPQETDKIIDVHTHLGNACGIKSKKRLPQKQGPIKESFLSRIGYSRLFNYSVVAGLVPKSPIASTTAYASAYASPENLLFEMERNKIHRCFILPVEPNISTKETAALCKGKQGLTSLCSVDLVNLKEDEIKEEVEKRLQLYKCPGIKFHPNLQATSPLSKKARILYEVARRNNVFILIHVGRTPFLKYPKNSLALFKNFIGLLDTLKENKIIFAHMCKYFDPAARPFGCLMKYPNVFLDTSGVDSDVIYEGLYRLGPERIVFGSDWPFGLQAYSIYLVKKAVDKYCKVSGHNPDDILKKIFYGNIETILQ